MEFDTYQTKARETAIYPGSKERLSRQVAEKIFYLSIECAGKTDKEDVINAICNELKLLDLIPLLYTALGLAGETGELLEKIKKVIRDKDGVIDEETKDALKKELGDQSWYQANLATELGISLNDTAQLNLDKLASRKERGVLQGSGDNR